MATSAMAQHPKAQVSEIQTLTDFSLFQTRIRTTGGAFFYPKKGQFKLSVMKMDPRKWVTLRAILVSPAREVLADVWIPGTQKEKQFQKVDFTVDVQHEGVYALCITAVNDRYGDEIRWGFTTNCEKYLIETSRGHRDARHEEPIVVLSGDHEGDIFFQPSTKAFGVQLSRLLPDMPAAELRDDQGKVVATFTRDEEGKASCQVEADDTRKAPWSLHLPKMQVVLEGDHITRWDKDSLFPNAAIWTDKRSAWFDYLSNRHLLHPYNFSVNIPEGQKQTVTFTMQNLNDQPKQVRLELEYDGDTPHFAKLPFTEVTLPAQCKEKKIAVECTSCQAGSCRLRVTADDFTTYSTITVRQAEKAKSYAFKKPLLLTPYNHENQQLAFAPDYPTIQQPYFDMENRPFVLTKAVMSLHDGKWLHGRFIVPGVKEPSIDLQTFNSTKIAFDKENWVYVVVNYNRGQYLAYSSDNGLTFKLAKLPINGSIDIEAFTGHNMPPGPPPIVIHKHRDTGPRTRQTFWRSENDMYLAIPVKKDGEISFLPPIHVTKLSLGISLHSGIPCTIVSFENRTHLIWPEATDPNDKSIIGVPTYVATYDHTTGKLSSPALIGFGPPANDVHNTPCITLDSKGYLHALIGTHGSTFKYARSLKPNTAEGGWTPAQDVGDKLSQTYIGLVCDKDDVLHTAFRLWGTKHPIFPNGTFAQLSQQEKPAMGDTWSTPETIIYPAFTDYSVFYHRLVIDRKGTLYLSYTYWSTYWFYRNEQISSRALIKSEDGGKNWSLVAGFN